MHVRVLHVSHTRQAQAKNEKYTSLNITYGFLFFVNFDAKSRRHLLNNTSSRQYYLSDNNHATDTKSPLPSNSSSCPPLDLPPPDRVRHWSRRNRPYIRLLACFLPRLCHLRSRVRLLLHLDPHSRQLLWYSPCRG